ncbi:PAS domain-containing protein [Methylocapsa sp. S129]|uniref:PAS domain-containing protein n=1 Tax=Methylocapsa sp. S129 TaxID=1641869 RepID=UPI00131CB277|nr:PAS domain-containing protein [Methylocapsa sp. S129]
MKLAASRELHSYWNLLRGGRSAPERSEIDPGAIRGVLADTFILEVDRSKRYPIRIAGTRTNSLFARELKGAAFLDLWQTPDQREIAAILASVADETVAVLAGVSTHPPGLRPLDLELLLLPLRHHGDTRARILGAFSPAFLPSWIGLLPAAPMTLSSLRVLGRAESSFRKQLSAARDEPARAMDFGRTPHFDRRGHLFVFTSAAEQR